MQQAFPKQLPILTDSDIQDFRVQGKKLISYLEKRYRLNSRALPINQDKNTQDIYDKLASQSQSLSLSTILEIYSTNLQNQENSLAQSAYNLAPFHTYTALQSVYGDTLSLVYGSPGFTWIASPLATELQIACLDQLAIKLDLPTKFYTAISQESQGLGIINICQADTIISLLVSAKAGKIDQLKEKGKKSNKQIYVFYTFHCEEIMQIQRVAEVSQFVVRIIPTVFEEDSKSYIIDFQKLKQSIQNDLKSQNLTPLMVAAKTLILGQQIEKLSKLCKDNKIWLHLIGEDAIPLSFLQPWKYMRQIYSHYDSISMNAGYWFGCGIDSNILWCRDRQFLKNGLEFRYLLEYSSYLKTEKIRSNYQLNYKNYSLFLGRKNRSFKLWVLFNSFGISGFRKLFQQRIELTRKMEAALEISGLFTIKKQWKPHQIVFRVKNSGCDLDMFVEKVKADTQIELHIWKNGKQKWIRIWLNHFKVTNEIFDQISKSLIKLAAS